MRTLRKKAYALAMAVFELRACANGSRRKNNGHWPDRFVEHHDLSAGTCAKPGPNPNTKCKSVTKPLRLLQRCEQRGEKCSPSANFSEKIGSARKRRNPCQAWFLGVLSDACIFAGDSDLCDDDAGVAPNAAFF